MPSVSSQSKREGLEKSVVLEPLLAVVFQFVLILQSPKMENCWTRGCHQLLTCFKNHPSAVLSHRPLLELDQ